MNSLQGRLKLDNRKRTKLPVAVVGTLSSAVMICCAAAVVQGYRLLRSPRTCAFKAKRENKASPLLRPASMQDGDGMVSRGGDDSRNAKKPRQQLSAENSGSAEQHAASPAKPKGVKPPRPNYFIAVQCSENDRLVSRIDMLHEQMVAHDPSMKRALVDSASAHLTLAVIHVPTDDQLAESLDSVADRLREFVEECPSARAFKVQAGSLGHFRNQVLKISLKDAGEGKVVELAEALKAFLLKSSVCVTDTRECNPHITVAKASKMHGRHRGRRQAKHAPLLSEELMLLLELADADYQLGNAKNEATISIAVDSLQLCRMAARPPNAYYHVESSVLLPTSATS